MTNKQITILITNESPVDQDAYERLLSPFNIFKIYTAYNAQETLEHLAHQPVDCILLDYELPDFNGIDLLKIIQEDFDKLRSPAIIMMVRDERFKTVAFQAIKYGGQDYLFKDQLSSLSLGHTILQAVEKQRLEKELQNIQEELLMFSSRASHDLRSPLRQIQGFTQLLDERLELDETSRQMFQFVLKNVAHMDNLLNALEDYTQAGRVSTQFQSINLSIVINEVQTLLYDELTSNEIELVCDEMPTVVGDFIRLTQLFRNLIGNCLKFRQVGQKLVIAIQSIRVNDMWQISIKDNGIGIDPQFHSKIFEPFQRLHAQGEKGKGSGLGLATCQKIVEQHNGRIWVESTPNQGATFYFTLPAVEAHQSNKTRGQKNNSFNIFKDFFLQLEHEHTTILNTPLPPLQLQKNSIMG